MREVRLFLNNRHPYADEEHEEHHEVDARSKPAEALDEETDNRQHLNVVFIGHVGKISTVNNVVHLDISLVHISAYIGQFVTAFLSPPEVC